jgi:hypothetical protein
MPPRRVTVRGRDRNLDWRPRWASSVHAASTDASGGCLHEAWCSMHYQRWLKRGDPLKRLTLRGRAAERVWERVPMGRPDECWPAVDRVVRSEGYAYIGGVGRSVLLHRVVYELLVAPIPDGMTLDHLCHTSDPSCAGGPGCSHRRCCNPAHMEIVTRSENIRRGRGPHHANRAKTHCIRGHAFTPENTYVQQGRFRGCRKCRAAGQRRRRRTY